MIDYIIVNETDENCISEIIIDEEKFLAPYRLIRSDEEIKAVYSDHNAMICNINWTETITKSKEDPMKIITEKGYRKYRQKVKEQNVANMITQNENVQTVYDNWTKQVMEIKKSCEVKKKIHKCSKLQEY